MLYLLLLLVIANTLGALKMIILTDAVHKQRLAQERLAMDVFKFNADLVHHTLQINFALARLELSEIKNKSGEDHVNS